MPSISNQKVMPKTGEKCSQSGTYKCAEHGQKKLFILQGDTFPACHDITKEPHPAMWIFTSVKELT